MKKKTLRSFITALILVLLLASPALAVNWADFTDISGHWAESTVKKGFEDGLIEGYEDGTVKPDAPITAAQMITILTRVLGATEKADASSLGVGADQWFYEPAQKAAYLGLIDAKTGNLDAPMTRQNAFAMLSKAFALTAASPDYSSLNAFADQGSVKPENRRAVASLISSGLVQGDGNLLNPNGSINRAEFLTVLYRVAASYIDTSSLGSGRTGGVVLKGSGSVNFITADKLWLDCSAQNVSLYSVNAKSVALRSHKLTALSIAGQSRLDVLSIALSPSAELPKTDLSSASIGTLRLQSCKSALIGKNTDSVEVTGDGMDISVENGPSSIVVSGNNNLIKLSSEAKLKNISLLGNGNKLVVSGSAESISVSGSDNTVTVNGSAESISVSGAKTTLDGTGSAKKASITATGCQNSLKIENVDDSSAKLESERVLKLVTTGYKGNYTLQWAQEHDYQDYEKETWVNAKGHASETDYLIWVNISMQRVNIFKGSKGNWKLVRSAIVGSGAPGHSTPVGVYTTTYKQAAGWTTSTYTCRPVIGFKKNTGYAFHSRLYYPGSNKLTDARIGFPVSHGCIRMYDEDVNYIYDNIPIGSTVVVY